MQAVRPYVVSIAGFDPSGGAGILADIKTFEANAVCGFGVCTAITFQDEKKFTGLEWLDEKQVIQQIEAVFLAHTIDFVKIGIVHSIEGLENIVDALFLFNPGVKIIWDPVLKASAGYVFHKDIDVHKMKAVLRKVFLVTPNLKESGELFGEIIPGKLQNIVASEEICSILLKGGHAPGKERNDYLIRKNIIVKIEGDEFEGFTKHGTGCVLSAAITANMAKGFEIKEACIEAKSYIHRFIKSNHTLLGYHAYNG